MKSSWKIAALGLAVAFELGKSTAAVAEDEKPASTKGIERARPAAAPVAAVKPKLTQEELEAKFKRTLAKATFSGRWCGIKNGQLTPEKEDKYTINSVTKLNGDSWIITARIQYANHDFAAPIPVEVKWAGDTPVITVDNFGIPGGNSYSARVLIYDQTYAGTWSGGKNAGLMNGIITNEETQK